MEVIDDQFLRPRSDFAFAADPEAALHTGKLVHFRDVDKELDLPAGTAKALLNEVAARYGLQPSIETENIVRYERVPVADDDS
jgi:hypothetical protein